MIGYHTNIVNLLARKRGKLTPLGAPRVAGIRYQLDWNAYSIGRPKHNLAVSITDSVATKNCASEILILPRQPNTINEHRYTSVNF
jgi:hypothetical protein